MGEKRDRLRQTKAGRQAKAKAEESWRRFAGFCRRGRDSDRQ